MTEIQKLNDELNKARKRLGYLTAVLQDIAADAKAAQAIVDVKASPGVAFRLSKIAESTRAALGTTPPLSDADR